MTNEFKTWTQEKTKGSGWAKPMALRSGYGGVIHTGVTDWVIITTSVNPIIFEMNNARYRDIQTNLHDWALGSYLGSHGPSLDLAKYALKKKWAVEMQKGFRLKR